VENIIQIEYNGNTYELSEDIVSSMLETLYSLHEYKDNVSGIEEEIILDLDFMYDVRLLLDEVEESLIED